MDELEATPVADAESVTDTTGAPPEPLADAPWAKDRDAYIEDPTTRVAFDRYMKEKQQPYITSIEQDRASLREKAAWFEDLESDPDATLYDAVVSKYGDAAGEQFLALLDAGQGGAAAEASTEAAATLDADDRAALDFAKGQRAKEEQAAYLQEVDRVVGAHPHVNKDAFHLYVANAKGDFDVALAAYAKHFPAPAGEAPPPAPPTLSGGGGGTPVAPTMLTLDELGAALFAAGSGT